MSPAMKNIITVLGVFTIAFGAYYFYVQNDKSLSLGPSEDQEALLLKAEQFLELSAILAKIQIDTTVFDNKLFQSYQSFSTPVPEESYGRPNPFDDAGEVSSGDN